MNRKPVLLRVLFVLLVLFVFAWSMHPLKQQDFIETFKSRLTKTDKEIEEVFKVAAQKVEKNGAYASVAVEDAANELSIDLTKYVNFKNITCNKDVIGEIKKQASGSIRLGIDLNGGAEFILELKPKPGEEDVAVVEESENDPQRQRDVAIEIIRNRLEKEKIYESEISPAGKKFISLKVPIVSKDEKVKLLNLIKMSAALQFSLVHPENEKMVAEYEKDPRNFKIPHDYKVMEMVDQGDGKGSKAVKRTYFIKKKREMDGADIVNSFPAVDEFGQRRINLSFNSKGASRFAQVTKENVGRQLAIILDGTLYSAPVINEAISGGQAVISGNFSVEESQQISNALVSGSLPVRIEVEAIFDTDPTLGREEVQNGIKSGIIATVLVVGFMLIYYMQAGIVASIALAANLVLILGALAAFDATLTLPGIAGIILTIGMAVDANILIYERIREELKKNKTIPVAIETGFNRAFLTILDSNLTTLMIGLILLWQGTGPIKGFAVTLTIGILTSMFSAIFISRVVFDLLLRSNKIKSLKMLQLFSELNFDYMRISIPCIAVSLTIILASLGTMIVKGKDGFSIDFTGGTRVTYDYSSRQPESDILKSLSQMGYNNPKIVYKKSFLSGESQGKLEILLRDDDISKSDENTNVDNIAPKESIAKSLNAQYPNLKLTGGDETSIGGLIGMEFTKTAVISFILAIIGMIIYISIRFEFSYAIAGMVALIHDVIIATGIYLMLGGQISLNVIAALLTILGYSINDTIVVFDRVREDFTLNKNKTYKEIVNLSINQTMSRTVLTSGTTMLAVVVMMLMGGIAIRDFLSVLCIGIIVGTYSSIFIAGPIITVWHKKIGANVKK